MSKMTKELRAEIILGSASVAASMAFFGAESLTAYTVFAYVLAHGLVKTYFEEKRRNEGR